MAKNKKHTYRSHLDNILTVITWVWANKWVLGGIATGWSIVVGFLLTYIFIPLATPVVRPIIKHQWKIMVKPYDSAIVKFDKRIKFLEDKK